MFIVDEKIGSKYRFVLICAQRTKQLLEGAQTRVESPFHKPAFVAMQEVLAGKIDWKVNETTPPALPDSGEVLQVEVGP
ncbi:MAG: DNA-directed RNA polymerase subunit omega [Acidobacteriota bacterium]|jgi:DNA-directed RNA polymerase omega subunit